MLEMPAILNSVSEMMRTIMKEWNKIGGSLELFSDSLARYHCLPNVSINRAFTNGATNPEKKRNHFSA